MESINKYTIIYSFKVNDGKENEFIDCWTELTKLIYKYEGSYGSKLHKINENLFIGYAQWPDKKTFEQSGDNLPATANDYRQKMRECCSEIKPEFKLESIVIDLLKDEQHINYNQTNKSDNE
jgi:quinol monooxygenase YgiN